MENNTKSLPMIPLRELTVLTEMVIHFDVSREETGRADFDSFAAESRVSSPVITYRYPETLFTGTYETDILVGATDAAGESIDVRIRSVTM